MKTILFRTGSVPVHSSFVSGSPRVSLSNHDSASFVYSGNKTNVSSHLEVNRQSIRRVLSESNLIRSKSEVSGGFSKLNGVGSFSFPARIPEEEYVSDDDEEVVGGVGSLTLIERGFELNDYAVDWPDSEIPMEEIRFPGGGSGNGRNSGSGDGGNDFGIGGLSGGNADRSQIGSYYQEMLKSNPTNSLLLRNYGKFLDEVEGDAVKAEEYYGRAILASPGDGEVLSLYGKLIWETQRDENRAQSYFNQAVQASPDDCMVLGSYAQFMWEVDEEDEEDEEIERESKVSPAMVEAF